MSDASRSYTADYLASTEGPGAAESVGGALRRAREKRGQSLAEISRELCLKEDTLRALESRQYSALPKVPYCFGFVRTYARALGLEPEEMVRRFKIEIGDTPQSSKLLPPQPLRGGRLPGRAALTFSVFVAAAAYAGWYFYTAEPDTVIVPATTADAHAPMAPVPLIEAEQAKRLNAEVDAANQARAEADAAKTGATTSAAPAEKAGIVVKAVTTCWVYIHDTKGRVVFHKTMQKGDEFKVPDAKGLVIDLANPYGVQIVYNGRVLKAPAGAPGKAVRVSLEPQNLAKLP